MGNYSVHKIAVDTEEEVDIVVEAVADMPLLAGQSYIPGRYILDRYTTAPPVYLHSYLTAP